MFCVNIFSVWKKCVKGTFFIKFSYVLTFIKYQATRKQYGVFYSFFSDMWRHANLWTSSNVWVKCTASNFRVVQEEGSTLKLEAGFSSKRWFLYLNLHSVIYKQTGMFISTAARRVSRLLRVLPDEDLYQTIYRFTRWFISDNIQVHQMRIYIRQYTGALDEEFTAVICIGGSV